MNAECGFCGQDKKLRNSHVLPKFLFTWLKGVSGTGHIRNTVRPNRRVQDGLKLYWLCADCETEFSKYETYFSNKIFHPWHDGCDHFRYDKNFLKFCVSISWRVVAYLGKEGLSGDYTDEQSELLESAERRWKGFLMGENRHPGPFEQHFLVFDIVGDTNIDNLPSNFNRFMTNTITFDIVGSSRSLMTYAKLGPFTIFGIIQKGPDSWQGTRVCVESGEIKPGSFRIPASLLDLFISKAGETSRSLSEMSESQRAKVEQHVAEHLDDFMDSPLFRATIADLKLSKDGPDTE